MSTNPSRKDIIIIVTKLWECADWSEGEFVILCELALKDWSTFRDLCKEAYTGQLDALSGQLDAWFGE